MKKLIHNKDLIAILAGLMAIISLAVAVWDGVESRHHNRLSVKPFINFSANYTLSRAPDDTVIKYELHLEVVNNGLGPAIIENFEIEVTSDGDTMVYNNWNDALKALSYNDYANISGALSAGSLIQSEDRVTLIKLNLLTEAKGSLKVRVKFQSIYEEIFTEDTDLFKFPFNAP